MTSDNAKKEEDKPEYFLYASLTIALLGIALVPLVYILSFGTHLTESQSTWGQFGDYFGDVLNPIIAFAALAGLLAVIRLQRTELREAQGALKESAAAQVQLVRATIRAQIGRY